MVIGRMAALTALLVLAAGQASANELRFRAALDGVHAPTATGSAATGQALITVDTERRTVAVSLDVKGIGTGDLWTNLLKAPIGPIHLHVYGGHDHSNPDSAELMFPAPYGPAYEKTAAGFRLEMRNVAYDTGAKLVESRASFDEFVSALKTDRIVVNIHTNRFTGGEISGDVVPAA